jgi:hypothetical protein
MTDANSSLHSDEQTPLVQQDRITKAELNIWVIFPAIMLTAFLAAFDVNMFFVIALFLNTEQFLI